MVDAWYSCFGIIHTVIRTFIIYDEVNLIDAMRCEYWIVLFHFELIWPVLNRILLLYSVRFGSRLRDYFFGRDRKFACPQTFFSWPPSHADLIARWFDTRNLFAVVQEIAFSYAYTNPIRFFIFLFPFVLDLVFATMDAWFTWFNMIFFESIEHAETHARADICRSGAVYRQRALGRSSNYYCAVACGGNCKWIYCIWDWDWPNAAMRNQCMKFGVHCARCFLVICALRACQWNGNDVE